MIKSPNQKNAFSHMFLNVKQGLQTIWKNSITKMRVLPHWAFLIILGSIAVYGMILVYSATPYGLGQINDSAAYIAGARAIYQGIGYKKIWLDGGEVNRITAYPPFTSIVLAIIALSGIDAFPGFKILNLVLFGLSILLAGYLGGRISGNKLVGILVAFLFTTNREFITIYSYAISEPLYLTITLLGYNIFHYWIVNKKNILLFALGIVISMATLTRNAGLTLLTSSAVIVLIFSEKKIKALILLGCSFAPATIIWWIRNEGSEYLMSSPRRVELRLVQEGLNNLENWFFASSTWNYKLVIFEGIEIIFYAILAIGLIINYRKIFQNREQFQIIFLLTTYSLLYIAVLAFSVMYVEESVGLSDRILSPLYLALLMIFPWIFIQAWGQKKSVQLALATLTIFIVFINQYSARTTVNKLSNDGQGYSALHFRQGPIAEYVNNLSPDTVIFTNSPPALYSASNGKRNSKGINTRTEPGELKNWISSITGGKDFVIVCYGCTNKYTKNLLLMTSDEDLVLNYGRDSLYHIYSQDNP